MASLINRDIYRAKMLAAMEDGYLDEDTVEAMINILDCEPSIETMPAIRGHWEKHTMPEFEDYDRCSVCGEAVKTRIKMIYYGKACNQQLFLKYCPNCGAKMEETK